MQNKNNWHRNLRLKLLVGLCVVMLLSQGLFVRPALALEPSKEPVRPLADILNNKISVVSWGVGRLNVFVIKPSDGSIWMKTYDNGTFPPGWSAWSSLGKPGAYNSSVEAVSWSSGRLDVFAVDFDKTVWHRTYIKSGLGWYPWENIGGGTFPFDQGIQAVSWASGRIDLFNAGMGSCRSYNDCFGDPFFHKWYQGGWGPSQTGWEQLDNSLFADSYVIPWRNVSPQWLHIFQRDRSNDSLWYKYWNGSTWSGWNALNGQARSAPFALSWGSPRLDVLVRGMDGSIWHDAYKGAFLGWTGWESLGGTSSGDTGMPSAVSWASGRLDVFETTPIYSGGLAGTSAWIYHKYWDGSAWGPAGGWENLGIGPFYEAPKVVSWSSGRLDLFGRNVDGTVYHKWFQGGWGPSIVDWESLGAP